MSAQAAAESDGADPEDDEQPVDDVRPAGRAPAERRRDAPDDESPDVQRPDRAREEPAEIERGAGGRWPVAERSLLANVLGVPPLAAVALAGLLTAIGAAADLLRTGTPGLVFSVCHIAGCVLAVVWVRRRSLFAAVVQPPLLVAVAVPAVVLLAGGTAGEGAAGRLLAVGAPLVNAFPTMATSTAVVLLIGLLRVLVQRPARVSAERRSGRGAAARAAARTPASPRRS